MRRAFKPWPLLLTLALASMARFWDLGRPALIGDEAYYWLWSQRLALSYYDHPPGIALLIRVSTLLAGDNELGVRALNAALGVVSVGLAYALGEKLSSRTVGLASAMALALGAPYLVTSRFVYTDTLHLVLMLANLCLLAPVLLSSSEGIPRWRFLALGLSIALLFNTKYSAYIYGLSVAIIVFIRRPNLMRERWAWFAVGVALLGLAPTLVWNALHGWSSFRWQIVHMRAGTFLRGTLMSNLAHAVDYFSPPLVLLAALSLFALRSPRERWLLLIGLSLVVPVVLSPANSPRSAASGVAILLLLGAQTLLQRFRAASPKVTVPMLGLWLCAIGLYGANTVRATLRPIASPHSGVADTIRNEIAGWRVESLAAIAPGNVVFALDYSLAGHLRYYANVDAYTSWGQYRIWGIPDLDPVVVASLPYVDEALVEARLSEAYDTVEAPTTLTLREKAGTKTLRLWRASGRRLDKPAIVDSLDFADLMRETLKE